MTKPSLLGGTAFIRPTAAERQVGRLMCAPDGHDGGGAVAPATPAAPADTAAPAADATALGAGDGGDGAAEGGDATALGGKPDGEGAGEGEGEAAKTPEELAADAEAAKADVPEAYELTAPEGMTINPVDLEAATPIFKELGLSNEQANKLMPVAAQFAQRIADQANQAIIAQVQHDRKAWLDTARADPEIGGQHWDGTIKTAASALDKLGFVKGSPFRVLLDESGLGNHPEMIRAFSKVGEAIGEDSGFVRTESGDAPKSIAKTLFGKN